MASMIDLNKYKDVRFFIRDIDDVINEDNPQIRTIAQRYTHAKNLFKKYYPKHEFLDKIKPIKSITLSVMDMDKKSRDDRKMIEINDDIMNEIKSWKNSDNIYDKILYLLFVSGRRVSEIIGNKTKFMKYNDHIYVKGLLKKKHKDGCIIYPMIDNNEFMNRYNYIKDYIRKSGRSRKAFHDQLYIRVKKKIGLTIHSLRAIYVLYMYKHYNKNNYQFNEFIRRRLCHDIIESSLSYTKYKLLSDIKI